MLPVVPFVPNVEGIKWLAEKMIPLRDQWAVDLPNDPIEFTALVSGTNSVAFTVGETGQEPLGLFLFTSVEPGNGAVAHVFVWDREKVNYKDLINAAQTTLAAMMAARELHRITGITPSNKPEALKFAQAVGFKLEGTLRSAVVWQGKRYDAWITGILARDLGVHFRPQTAPSVID